MSYNRRRNLGFTMRDRRLAQGVVETEPLVPAPTAYTGRVVHLARRGGKAARQFTLCGRGAAGAIVVEDPALVTCAICRKYLHREGALCR